MDGEMPWPMSDEVWSWWVEPWAIKDGTWFQQRDAKARTVERYVSELAARDAAYGLTLGATVAACQVAKAEGSAGKCKKSLLLSRAKRLTDILQDYDQRLAKIEGASRAQEAVLMADMY